MTSHPSPLFQGGGGGGGEISSLGLLAADALASSRTARCMGRTSRGLFLGLNNGWVVFLSAETWCGPLTLNLGPLIQRLPETDVGAVFSLAPGRLAVSDFVISWDRAVRWQPPAIPANNRLQSPGARHSFGQAVVREALRSGRASVVTGLLSLVLGLDVEQLGDLQGMFSAPVLEPPMRSWCEQAMQALERLDVPSLADSLHGFVGLGGGLTPSGDDLILGFVLALVRWGVDLRPEWPAAQQHALAARLVDLVRQDSTSLSASLVACAARGHADERLIQALDGLVTGQPSAAVCTAALAGWGNTSGFDALAGMGLFLGNTNKR